MTSQDCLCGRAGTTALIVARSVQGGHIARLFRSILLNQPSDSVGLHWCEGSIFGGHVMEIERAIRVFFEEVCIVTKLHERGVVCKVHAVNGAQYRSCPTSSR